MLSNDPLADSPRFAPSDAGDCVDDFSYAEQRLSACLEQRPGGQPTADELALQDEAQAFEDAVDSRPRSWNRTRLNRASS